MGGSPPGHTNWDYRVVDLEDRGPPWDVRAVLRFVPGGLGQVPLHLGLKTRLDQYLRPWLSGILPTLSWHHHLVSKSTKIEA